jgi:putative transposase
LVDRADALDLARTKKNDLAVELCGAGRFPMKAVTETLGVARSNVAERVKGICPKRGPRIREGDSELTAEIRRLVDARPTYGYRRIAPLIKRERRSGGGTPVNAKRVYRLMKKHGLLLARHTGRRRPRGHDGSVVTLRSKIRLCSDGLEFTCWNGEVVRVAFALDCHDREVIGWVAATAGISGEMIRDLMVECVGRRFGTVRAPHSVQWLADNGSVYAAAKTLDIVIALNLEPCFTPVESSESNDVAEAFVKTLQARLRPSQRHPGCRHRARNRRRLDKRLQRSPPTQQTGLSLTKGIHQRSIATCRLSGLAGSTPPGLVVRRRGQRAYG